MDRNRLLLFFTISASILALSEFFLPRAPHPAHPPVQPAAVEQSAHAPGTTAAPDAPGLPATPAAPDVKSAPRVKIDGARIVGSLSLLGARLDDIALRGYHETIDKSSPLVTVLDPADSATPGSIQLGWAAGGDVKVPDDTTLWTSSGGDLSSAHPLTISWDNGQGQTYKIDYTVDANYMFTARQTVQNKSDKPVEIWPWQRIRRDYAPPPPSSYGAFEGLFGVAEGRTHQQAFAAARTTAEKNDNISYTDESAGGWASICDKYWLTALIPDAATPVKAQWFFRKDDGVDHYQVSYQTAAPQHVSPGATAVFDSHIFVGAKEVRLLDKYESDLKIPLLSYSVDWGHYFFFLTRPFFVAIDWLYAATGNFGIAILIFTICVKIVFYPLARKSFESMGKMRLLTPKIQAARERHKDDPALQQAAMMEVYKQEGISPMAQAGGCLPMVIQIPVFISLYSVILITIEIRHAPFFGWIHDLSVVDPTNIFTLFGLLPYQPELISPYLHLGIWPVLMGATMYFQQKMNPPPPDPAQAKMFQYMPIFFTFLMGRAPAGLVIYWTWNNLLTMAQQWHIQRHVTLSKK